MPNPNDLLEQYKTTHDPNVQEDLLRKWIPYVRWVVQRFTSFLPPGVDMEDMMSQGMLGLINAINTFNGSKGVEFKTYAFYRIKGAIFDELRRLNWKPRSIERKAKKLEKVYTELEDRFGRMPTEKEVADELNMEIDEFYKLLEQIKGPQLLSLSSSSIESEIVEEIIPSPETDLLSVIQKEELKGKLIEIIDNLPKREKLLIMLYYYEDLTLKEIGKVMGLTESRISQIHTHLLLHLRNVLKKLV